MKFVVNDADNFSNCLIVEVMHSFISNHVISTFVVSLQYEIASIFFHKGNTKPQYFLLRERCAHMHYIRMEANKKKTQQEY